MRRKERGVRGSQKSYSLLGQTRPTYYHVKRIVIFVWYCAQIAAQTVHTVQGDGLHRRLHMVQDWQLLVQDGWLINCQRS